MIPLSKYKGGTEAVHTIIVPLFPVFMSYSVIAYSQRVVN
jgi:hypothetical protein